MLSSAWLGGVSEFVILMFINLFRVLPSRPGAGVAELVL
jgi:hypothetical protein